MATTWNLHRDDQVTSHELYLDPFWGRFVQDAARSASQVSSDEYDREDNIRRGLDVVEATARAVTPDWWDRSKGQSPRAWHHRSVFTLTNKKHSEPHIMRLEVEEATASYLRLPYRVDALDRLLADMLIAAEMFAFADERQPQLKQKLPTVLSWLWNNLKSLVIGLSLAGVLIWLAPNSTVMQWTAGIIAALTLLNTAFSLVVFPFLYPEVRTQRQKFERTVRGMLDAYATLGGSPASVPHISKMVERATDAGVIWPAPLMALLDDIAERRKAI